MYTLAMAKNDYKAAWINKFRVINNDNGWTLQLYMDSQHPAPRLLGTARGEDVRVFKTIDAAIKTAEEIGFKIKGLESIDSLL